jgi:glucuronate isomerase
MGGMTTLAPAGPLALDPDRLLPVGSGTREVARRLYAAVAEQVGDLGARSR